MVSLENILKWLNKKGISATVIGVILLVVGLAIVILIVIFSGQSAQSGFSNMIDKLNIIRHGGG
jgi:predicted PurR-regulated permease PerM